MGKEGSYLDGPTKRKEQKEIVEGSVVKVYIDNFWSVRTIYVCMYSTPKKNNNK